MGYLDVDLLWFPLILPPHTFMCQNMRLSFAGYSRHKPSQGNLYGRQEGGLHEIELLTKQTTHLEAIRGKFNTRADGRQIDNNQNPKGFCSSLGDPGG
jgi:hypothetical protein